MAVAVTVMVLSIALFMGMLYQHFTDQIMGELQTETQLVAQGVEVEGLNYLQGMESRNRITWVAGDGTVLYDSQADASKWRTTPTVKRSARRWRMNPVPPSVILPPWPSRPCTPPSGSATGP